MTGPEPVRADTFDLQGKKVARDAAIEPDHTDLGAIGPLDEEEETIYDDEHDEDDDDADALSSSPSIPDDDIDFDFMYALHSFAATVEGQANATKGDMLVLLDDSNSYWWLVRVVKDHTVGYLPAETIETPQERLARLNKHRNIDRTAVMLEDHSPTSRSGTRKPFRRKGGKSVAFNNSCTYYQLDTITYDTSDGEEDEDEGEPLAVEDKLEDDDLQEGIEDDRSEQSYGRKDDYETDTLHDTEEDAPQPSPRMGMDSADGSAVDHAGRKVMRIRDLNDERPTSEIFRDSKLEPLKISVTPSIARDRVLLSPDEQAIETAKNKSTEADRKRSLSISSNATDSGNDSDSREKENAKKGKKNSVFGNLFRKRSRKSSRDEDANRDDDVVETKEVSIRGVTDEDEDIVESGSLPFEPSNIQNMGKEKAPEDDGYSNGANYPANKKIQREDTPITTMESEQENLMSPGTQTSSTLPTPLLPWSDASVHSFLDHDTSIRDALVLIYEGSRLRKRASIERIDPHVADLFGACAVHIDEMSSHLDDVLTSYIFGVKAQG